MAVDAETIEDAISNIQNFARLVAGGIESPDQAIVPSRTLKGIALHIVRNYKPEYAETLASGTTEKQRDTVKSYVMSECAQAVTGSDPRARIVRRYFFEASIVLVSPEAGLTPLAVIERSNAVLRNVLAS